MLETGCGQLRRVNISAPRLQSLNVSGSGGLRELVVDCPVMTTLIASQCRKLDELGPTFLAPQLTTLNLFGCRALRPEGMHHHADRTCPLHCVLLHHVDFTVVGMCVRQECPSQVCRSVLLHDYLLIHQLSRKVSGCNDWPAKCHLLHELQEGFAAEGLQETSPRQHT